MSDRQLVVALDHGSTMTKAALVDLASGSVVASSESETPQRRNGAAVTLDAGDVLAAVQSALGTVVRDPPGSIQGIALASQRSTCLLWDKASGAPLTPCLSWQDTSQSEYVAGFEEHADQVTATTGLRLSPHYAASKLRHLIDSLDGGRRRAENGELVAGTIDAFLCRTLTGLDSTDPGCAGRTLLCDLESGHWDDDLCDLFGVPKAALPTIEPSVGLRAGRSTSPQLGPPVLVLAGDQQAALLGHGGWEPGVMAAHFGTGAFLLAGTGDRIQRTNGLLSAVLVSTPGATRYQIEGSVNAAGSAVDWACGLHGITIREWRDRSLDPAILPQVFPAFSGAAAPWWKPDARAVIAGLTTTVSPDDLIAATLCGVAQRVADCFDRMAEGGITSTTLHVSGKLTRSQGLVQLLANLTGTAVSVAAEEESGLAGLLRAARAAIAENDEPLSARPHQGAEAGASVEPPLVEPQWREPRRRAERERWLSFAARAVES